MIQSGIVLVDKPVGISSFSVVYKMRKITGIKKIGHTGTLDPFASGLLPICIGRATRLTDFIITSDKEYIAEMKLGIKTDSADITGNIIAEMDVPNLMNDTILEIAKKVCLMTEQLPPKYSAIKIDGKRAYKLARENKDFEMKSRPIKILEFEIIKIELPKIVYRAKVSKGTYIRTLSEDFAEMLNCIATTTELRRISSGEMKIEDAFTLDELSSENWESKLTDLLPIFSNYPKITLDSNNIENFRHGRRFYPKSEDVEKILILDENNNCHGFAQIENGKLQPKIVLT